MNCPEPEGPTELEMTKSMCAGLEAALQTAQAENTALSKALERAEGTIARLTEELS